VSWVLEADLKNFLGVSVTKDRVRVRADDRARPARSPVASLFRGVPARSWPFQVRASASPSRVRGCAPLSVGIDGAIATLGALDPEPPLLQSGFAFDFQTFVAASPAGSRAATKVRVTASSICIVIAGVMLPRFAV